MVILLFTRHMKQKFKNGNVSFINHKNGSGVSSEQFDKDLNHLVEFYGKIINLEIKNEDSSYSQGLFYMESQLEDFIINTKLTQ